MADYVEVSKDQVDKFNKALQEGDGIAARHMLEDVGSCGWPSLMRKTRDASGWHPFTISSFSESQSEGHEALEVYRLARSTPQVVIPLTKAVDKSCEKK